VKTIQLGFLASAALVAGVLLAGTFAKPAITMAQDVTELQTSNAPLVLQAQGSFFIGGKVINAAAGDLGAGRAPGQVVTDQSYVKYMIPQGAAKVPVVMTHGAGISGKSWETTPDGRMGFDEYFVRNRHPTYVVDRNTNGRAGFDVTVFNRVRAGTELPSALPSMTRTSAELAWTGFRFGPSYGVPYPDTQFPVEKMVEFAKQGIPSFSQLPPGTPQPLYRDLADLAIKLNGAVLMGHSASGLFPAEAALVDASGIKGIILTEPGLSPASYTDAQIAKLATVPILMMWNDHLGAGQQALFDADMAFIARINAAGGNAQMLHPPALGIHGNSHMFMLDKNNLQIADLILKWIDDNVGKQKVAKNK
jgi:hypothetical protein